VVICPICKAEVAALDKVGAADGFDCPTNGRFKVSTTVLDTKGDASRQEWEAALARAKAKDSDAWATVITSYDF
jgi:hypothetical protein